MVLCLFCFVCQPFVDRGLVSWSDADAAVDCCQVYVSTAKSICDDLRWQDHYVALVEIARVHGHCNVPQVCTPLGHCLFVAVGSIDVVVADVVVDADVVVVAVVLERYCC